MSDDALDNFDGSDQSGEDGWVRPVLVMTETLLRIEVHQIDSDTLSEGMVAAGAFLDGRLIARTAVPQGTFEFYQRHGFFEEPRKLVLAAWEVEPGLRCELYAIVPLPSTASDEADPDDADEPWLASADSQAYERSVSQGADAGRSGEENDKAALPLGHIIRFEKDRKHPESLALEALDILTQVVQGKVVPLVDKVLSDLLGPEGGTPGE